MRAYQLDVNEYCFLEEHDSKKLGFSSHSPDGNTMETACTTIDLKPGKYFKQMEMENLYSKESDDPDIGKCVIIKNIEPNYFSVSNTDVTIIKALENFSDDSNKKYPSTNNVVNTFKKKPIAQRSVTRDNRRQRDLDNIDVPNFKVITIKSDRDK